MKSAVVIVAKGAIAVLFGFLLLTQVVIVPLSASGTMAAYPEVATMWVPGVVWAVLVIACVQFALAITWHILSLAESRVLFRGAGYTPVNLFIAALTVFVALVAVGFITLSAVSWTPPLAMFALIGAGMFGFAILLVLIVVRRLLHEATQTAEELASLA